MTEPIERFGVSGSVGNAGRLHSIHGEIHRSEGLRLYLLYTGANLEGDMLRQTTFFVHTDHMKKMAQLAKSRGVASAVLVRLAIREYLHRESRKK